MSTAKTKMNAFNRRQFLKTGGAAVLGAFVSRGYEWPPQGREQTLYVGTYTSGKSEGIYVYRMNSVTGALTRLKSIQSVNPSFLVIDRSRRYLYAVNEVKEFDGKPEGAVSAFSIEPKTGSLTFLNQQSSRGADPCHLTVDRKRKLLVVANYTGGNVAVLPINGDGSLAAATDVKQHQGSSIKEQQNGPHTHCVVLDHSEQHALVTDLGIDKIMIYRLDKSGGKLIPGPQPAVPLQSGAGPRHLALHPNGKLVYVINELNSTVSTFKFDESHDTLSLVDTVSTLPVNFFGSNSCADIHVSANGKFLYGSNRGPDSIVVFAIDMRTGRPNYIEHMPSGGKWPRNFNIDPTGRFLLVANQHTDNVVSFKIDPQTGRLQPTGQIAEIPTPVCLKFA